MMSTQLGSPLDIEKLTSMKNESHGSRKQCFPIRYFMAILSFFGFWNVYGMRVNLSVAIVQIMEQTNSNSSSSVDHISGHVDKGVILSSFFWGYIVTQIPGGILAAKFGGSKVFGFGICSTAIFTILTPVTVRYLGLEWLVVLRVLQGLGEGVTYPSQNVLWSKWAPKYEKSKLTNISFTGSYAGTVISMPLCGFLAQKYGWESIFYVYGCLGFLWTIIWAFFASDEPKKNRLISENEITFIENNIDGKSNTLTIRDVPIKSMLKSLPLYAMIMCHFCENWGFYTLLTELPSYMKNILDFDLKKSGALSALPYLVLCVTMPCTGFVSDYLRKNNYLSTTAVRKIFNTIGFAGQMTFLLLVGFASSSKLAVVYLTLAIGTGGLASGSFLVNPLDLSNKYAGVIMGISNTIATIPGIVSPIITDYLTPDGTQNEWRSVFYLSSGIYGVGALFFLIFASGEMQHWNDL